MRIFLVENHPDTLTYLRRHLERAGHEVEAASTLAEALESLPVKPRDVLLSDLGLSDGDGCTLLEKLGAARPRIAIAMSGSGQPGERERTRAAGFQAYLGKPFLPDELDIALARAGMPAPPGGEHLA